MTAKLASRRVVKDILGPDRENQGSPLTTLGAWLFMTSDEGVELRAIPWDQKEFPAQENTPDRDNTILAIGFQFFGKRDQLINIGACLKAKPRSFTRAC